MVEHGHGRIETRTIKIAHLQARELDFPGARTIALVERQREDKKTGKTSTEVVPYISNLVEPTPLALLDIARAHWSVETLFHVRDRTCLEDRQTIRSTKAALTMALLRSTAASLSSSLGFRSLPDFCHAFAATALDALKACRPRLGFSTI